MTEFAFDVTVSSHDLLKAGITEARLPAMPHWPPATEHHHRIVVDAADVVEAALTAAQWAGHIRGAICTGTYLRLSSPDDQAWLDDYYAQLVPDPDPKAWRQRNDALYPEDERSDSDVPGVWCPPGAASGWQHSDA